MLETVWQEYRTALKAFLLSKVAGRDDVDDLLQEILIRTHNNIHTLKEASSIKAWLFSIANNVIIDFYRSRARKQGREQQLVADDLWLNEQSEPEFMQGLANCVVPFIQALPAQTSELLMAIDLQGRSQKQLAEELDISYSTLKSRVQKGRQELRGLFEQCCSFELDSRGNLMGCDPKQSRCNDC
ncbi:RNA polymerase sigma factor SigZ [Amphritea balenae]|uniref:RNA polymerase sigma factor SigZ n=1 Tax=Amphritea balenae TaxID=452629 RepID=A0A3P1SZA3_9GAMM|nr:RNA polymerase sigma factor SigZ [Amphritea balenae]RRD01453.1 RNA polymerase sigma factor SigZ [Amphritea balenae]GGK56993.1 RNA polymerase sigma factor SigZ [Amphritea balenae]